jgi:hypothetical protein
MKRAAVLAYILSLSILFWGCPYKSSIPLNNAVEKVDTNIIGKWVVESMLSNENPEYYVISKRDSMHYDVDHFQFNDDEKGYNVKQYVGHTTRLEAILFMNLQQSGSKEFLLYRLDVMPGINMTMYEVTDNIDEQFSDSKSMREFFLQHMKLSFFYNKDEVTLVKNKN